jgi:SpoIIAA-like
MIELLPGLPANVIGAEAVGHVETADYRDVLEPAVTAALAGHDKLRLLYVLGERFEGFSAGASWEDTKVGIGHWGAWERIAVVTDRDWIAHTVKVLGWMLPGDVRVFALAERDEAVTWVSA